MARTISRLLFSLLLLSATHAYAERTYAVSPSVGSASIGNIDGYKDSPYVRVDGTFYPMPQLGVGLFVANFTGFESSGNGNAVTIKINGVGAGVTGRWPVHAHVQPYVRVDYMRWDAEATALDRTVAKDSGGSVGLAVGAQFPIKSFFGLKAEVSGYNNVSHANIRQFSLGAVFEF